MPPRDKTGIEAQVRQWMKDVKRENSRLEFKLLIDVSTIGKKAEFIRDVIALANSEGEYPRENGLLVVGFKNGKYQDVAGDHYDGATFGQIIDANVFPALDTQYEEFSNEKRGRAGLLIIKPNPDVLYTTRKRVYDKNGTAELVPGQSWGRRGDRKIQLTGDAIHKRFCEIVERRVEKATTELQERIEKLEGESGPVLEVKRIRFELEATWEWAQRKPLIARLLPYAREFGYEVKDEVLDALSQVTGRTSQGMTLGVAQEVDSVLGELMPIGFGGMHHPSRDEITNKDHALLERIGHATFEMTWDACRYLRSIELVEVGARRFWYLIRYATLNGLQRLQSEFLRDARSCRDICNEERKGKAFTEAGDKLEQEIEDALDAFQADYIVRKVSSAELTLSILRDCVAIIRKGEAVDWQSAKRELPLATLVAIAFSDSQVVGVGAIKRERREYAARVSVQSGVSFPPETPELGYVAIDPDHQGRRLSGRISKLLVSQHSGRLFATTYNDRMKKTLEKAGFVKKGKEWKGRKYMLSFWDKE